MEIIKKTKEDQEGLSIQKGGILAKTIRDADTQEYITYDITEKLPRFLFDGCILEDGLQLIDIYQLMNKHKEFLLHVFGNWADEIIELGLQEPQQKSNLGYLELYYSIQAWEDGAYGGNFPSFHAIGTDNEKYAIDFEHPSSIAHLPIKLGGFTVYDMVTHKNITREKSSFLLGGILYSIIWELSYHGSQKDKEEVASRLLNLSLEVSKGFEEWEKTGIKPASFVDLDFN